MQHPEIGFVDVPSSVEHGAEISYSDTLQWIASQLIDVPEIEKLDVAERRLRELCSTGVLTAFGMKFVSGEPAQEPSAIPSYAWPRLWFSLLDGQPPDDHARLGGRYYGRAYWLDPHGEATEHEPNVGQEAWDAVYFLKVDVLNCPPLASESVEVQSAEIDKALVDLPNQREADADLTTLPSEEPTGPAKRPAWRALRALYPGGRIPKANSSAMLTRQSNEWLKKQPRTVADRSHVSESTVDRLLGRKT
jgi:hypothetical protein